VYMETSPNIPQASGVLYLAYISLFNNSNMLASFIFFVSQKNDTD
jgi:hypothetical protein